MSICWFTQTDGVCVTHAFAVSVMGKGLTLVLWVSLAVCLLGTVIRLFKTAQHPVERSIVITPAPKTRWGVLWFFVVETVLFKTLFKGAWGTWVFGWLFHLCLLLMFIIHLRYLSLSPNAITLWLMPHSAWIAGGLTVGLAGLLIRRLTIDRLRYISSPSDYLHLMLLLFIAAGGVLMARWGAVNVYEVTVFVQHVLSGQWGELTLNWLLAAHILGACLVMCLYPFSKLFHGPLSWFNPTRSQTGRIRS